MTILEEKNLLITTAQIAVQMVLARFKILDDEISQREACRMDGVTRSLLQSWQNEGLLRKTKLGENNSKVTYSRIELETIINLKKSRRLK